MTPIEYSLIAFGIYWFVSWILSCRNLYNQQGYLTIADALVAIPFAIFLGAFVIFGAIWSSFRKFLDFKFISKK